MFWRVMISIVVVSVLLIGCSVTPGDAARRAGKTEAAAKLYKQGAEQGDPLAAYKLAELNNRKNDQAAIHWYKRAIELGKENDATTLLSYYELGVIYDRLKEYTISKNWLLKSADYGHHYSMYHLGGLYADRKIKPNDDVTGLMWIEIVTKMASSYDKPNEGHLYILNDMEGYKSALLKRMKSSDIEKAKRKATEWFASKKR